MQNNLFPSVDITDTSSNVLTPGSAEDVLLGNTSSNSSSSSSSDANITRGYDFRTGTTTTYVNGTPAITMSNSGNNLVSTTSSSLTPTYSYNFSTKTLTNDLLADTGSTDLTELGTSSSSLASELFPSVDITDTSESILTPDTKENVLQEVLDKQEEDAWANRDTIFIQYEDKDTGEIKKVELSKENEDAIISTARGLMDSETDISNFDLRLNEGMTLYMQSDGMWATTPELSLNLNDDGSIDLNIAQEWLDDENFMDSFGSVISLLETLSQAYRYDPDYAFAVTTYNEDGSVAGTTEVKAYDYIMQIKDALQEYRNQYTSLATLRNDLLNRGYDVANLSYEELITAMSYGGEEDTARIAFPDYILNRTEFVGITALESFDPETNSVLISDFQENWYKAGNKVRDLDIYTYKDLADYGTFYQEESEEYPGQYDTYWVNDTTGEVTEIPYWAVWSLKGVPGVGYGPTTWDAKKGDNTDAFVSMASAEYSSYDNQSENLVMRQMKSRVKDLNEVLEDYMNLNGVADRDPTGYANAIVLSSWLSQNDPDINFVEGLFWYTRNTLLGVAESIASFTAAIFDLVDTIIMAPVAAFEWGSNLVSAAATNNGDPWGAADQEVITGPIFSLANMSGLLDSRYNATTLGGYISAVNEEALSEASYYSDAAASWAGLTVFLSELASMIIPSAAGAGAVKSVANLASAARAMTRASKLASFSGTGMAKTKSFLGSFTKAWTTSASVTNTAKTGFSLRSIANGLLRNQSSLAALNEAMETMGGLGKALESMYKGMRRISRSQVSKLAQLQMQRDASELVKISNTLSKAARRNDLLAEIAVIPLDTLFFMHVNSPETMRSLFSGNSTLEEKMDVVWNIATDYGAFAAVLGAAKVFRVAGNKWSQMAQAYSAIDFVDAMMVKGVAKATTVINDVKETLRRGLFGSDYLDKLKEKNPRKWNERNSRIVLENGYRAVAAAGKGLKGAERVAAIREQQAVLEGIQNAIDTKTFQTNIQYRQLINEEVNPGMASKLNANTQASADLVAASEAAGLYGTTRATQRQEAARKAGARIAGESETLHLPREVNNYIGYKVEVDEIERKIQKIADERPDKSTDRAFAMLDPEEKARHTEYSKELEKLEEVLPKEVLTAIDKKIAALQDAHYELTLIQREKHVLDETLHEGLESNGYTGKDNRYYVRTTRTGETAEATAEKLNRQSEYQTGQYRAKRVNTRQKDQHYGLDTKSDFINPDLALEQRMIETAAKIVDSQLAAKVIAMSSDARTILSGTDLAKYYRIQRTTRQMENAREAGKDVLSDLLATSDIAELTWAVNKVGKTSKKTASASTSAVNNFKRETNALDSFSVEEMVDVAGSNYTSFRTSVIDEQTWQTFYEEAPDQVKNLIKTRVVEQSGFTGFAPDFYSYSNPERYADDAAGRFFNRYGQEVDGTLNVQSTGMSAEEMLNMLYDRQRITGKAITGTELNNVVKQYPSLETTFSDARTALRADGSDVTVEAIVDYAYSNRTATTKGLMDGMDSNGDWFPTWEAYQATLKRYSGLADEIEKANITARPELWQNNGRVKQKASEDLSASYRADAKTLYREDFDEIDDTLRKGVRRDGDTEEAISKKVNDAKEELARQIDELGEEYISVYMSSQAFKDRVEAVVDVVLPANATEDARELATRYYAAQMLREEFTVARLANGKTAKEHVAEQFRELLKTLPEYSSMKLTGKELDKIANSLSEALESKLVKAEGELAIAVEKQGSFMPTKEKTFAFMRDMKEKIEAAEESRTVISRINEEGLVEFVEVDEAAANLYNWEVYGRYNNVVEQVLTSDPMVNINRLARVFQVNLNPASMVNQASRDLVAVSIMTGTETFGRTVSSTLKKKIVEEVQRLEPRTYALLQERALETGEDVADLVMRREQVIGDIEATRSTEYEFFKDRSTSKASKTDLGARFRAFNKTVSNAIDASGEINNKVESMLRKVAYNNGFEQARRAGKSLREAREHATFYARNATTNYNRQLYHLNFMLKTTNYVSSMFNGFRSFWRMVAMDPMAIAMRLFSGLMVPVAYSTVSILGDPTTREKYLQLDEDDKDDYFIFALGGNLYSVPVPEEMNWLMGSVRKTVESLYNGNIHEFWKLALDELLQFYPVDLSAVLALDEMVLTGDIDFGDRMGLLFNSIMSDFAPTTIKTIYEVATGTDVYYNESWDSSYWYIDGTTHEWVSADGNAGTFARAFAKLTGWNDQAVAKVIQNLFSSTGRIALDALTGTVLSVVGTAEEDDTTLLDLPESYLSRALNSLTRDDYSRTKSAWNDGLNELWDMRKSMTTKDGKELSLEEAYAEYTTEIIEAETDEERQEIIAKRDDLATPYFEALKNFIENYQERYNGTIDSYRFNSLISLANFGDITLSVADDAMIELAEDYENTAEALARRYLLEMGVEPSYGTLSSTALATGNLTEAFTSALTYVSTDDDGNVVIKFRTPAQILDAQATVYGDSDALQLAETKNIIQSSGISGAYSSVYELINQIYDSKDTLTSADYDEIDAIRVAWNEAVMERLVPYFSRFGIQSILDNSSIIDYLDGILMVPSSYAITTKGYYFSSDGLNKQRGYTKALLEDLYNEIVEASKETSE